MLPATPNPIAGIERGSVFLLARWSGPCVLARDCLRRAWSAAGLPDSELHILDWDEHEASLRELPELSGRVHSWGEAFHVRRGSITYFHVLGHKHSNIDREIQTFLQHAGNA